MILFVVVLVGAVATILGGGPSQVMEVLNAFGRSVIDTVAGWF